MVTYYLWDVASKVEEKPIAIRVIAESQREALLKAKELFPESSEFKTVQVIEYVSPDYSLQSKYLDALKRIEKILDEEEKENAQ